MENNKDFKRYEIIKKLILETFKKEILSKQIEFTFNFDFNTGIIKGEINGKRNAFFEIERNMKFKKIIKKLNKFVDFSKENEIKDCVICCEVIKQNAVCNECLNPICTDCYINIFRKNKGIFKCPFCSFSVGEEMTKLEVDIGVMTIKEKIAGYYKYKNI